MPDRELRHWKSLVRERAERDWRELSLEVVDELACHLADLHAAALRGGSTEHQARQAALDALNAASFLDLSKRPRSRRGVGYGHDVRIALRQLIATPIVSTVAVLSLALGIGANTAIFSLVNSLSLRALPVKDPQRLAILDAQDNGRMDLSDPRGTAPAVAAVRRRLRVGYAALRSGKRRRHGIRRRCVGDGGALRHPRRRAPLLGRTFTPADDVRGGGRTGRSP